MINIIYGSKGTGKTKQIIDRANLSIMQHKGDIVFIADTSRYVHDIKYQVRFTNTKDNNITTEDTLIGFIQGMLEANYDIRYMYIDGVMRMLEKTPEQLESFFQRLEAIASKTEVTFTLTISCDKEALPDFIKKHISD